METTFWGRCKLLFKNDPKPIFDHFRNIGISSAMLIGAAIMHYKTDNYHNNFRLLINVATCSVAIVGTFTAILNINYAQISLVKFLFGNKSNYNLIVWFRKIYQLYKIRKKINNKILKSIALSYFRNFVSQIAISCYMIFLYSLVGLYLFNQLDALNRQKVNNPTSINSRVAAP